MDDSMNKFFLIINLLFLINSILYAKETEVLIYGYVEGYYSKDNTKIEPENAQNEESYIRPYVIGGSKNNQFGLNYVLLGADVTSNIYRATLKMGTGEVAQEYFPLNGLLHEAYCGFQILDNLWFDAGFFLTNLCIESYYTYENPLSIFTIPGFVSEFYHTGARLSYEPTEELTFSAACIDAYSEFGDNNEDKSLSLFAEYLDSTINIYYASSIGNERPPDMEKALFMHHNLNFAFYGIGDFDFIAQLDLITQSKNDSTAEGLKTSYYYSLASWLSYYFTDQLYCSVRYTYFNNETNPLANTNLEGDLPATKGYSLGAGVTYAPTETSFLRVECNYLNFDKSNLESFVFQDGSSNMNSRYEFLFSYGIKFDILK
jgi:opacity protein-like surface antigen